MAHMHIARPTPKTNHLLTTTHNTQHKHTNKKHRHHGPPKLPAFKGSNFTGECNHHVSRELSRLLQHGDVLFIDDTNFSFIYLTAVLCAAARHTH